MLQGQRHGEKGEEPLTSNHIILLALGSNLTSAAGSPAQTLKIALNLLETHGAVIRAVSRFYHTPAFPAGAGPDYVNAAAKIAVPWTPGHALEILHKIEADMGRERVQRWGQRTLDLDMIAYDDVVLPDPQTHQTWRELPIEAQIGSTPDELILPHPRVQDRAFVLVPLADVAPDWVHPVLGKSVKHLLGALPAADKLTVRQVE
ncbi:MAG: 2-amino-4-hydroxy-6-hydroxymethyldihydropteridine diphosphokinase [Sulfitobacter sp.]